MEKSYKILGRKPGQVLLEETITGKKVIKKYTSLSEQLFGCIQEKTPLFNYVFMTSFERIDMVLFGVPLRRGSRHPESTVDQFPNILRKVSHNLLQINQYPEARPIKFFSIDEDREFNCGYILDIGDIIPSCDSLEREAISKISKTCILNKKAYVFIGGDHSYTYNSIASLEAIEEPVIMWHIDAHHDFIGDIKCLDHGNVVAHIAELPFVKKIIQIGARGLRTNEQLFSHDKILQIPKVRFNIKELRKEIQKYSRYKQYLSIDLDCLDPSCYSAVEFSVPNGLSKEELIEIIKLVFESGNVIGCDIVEGCSGEDLFKGNYNIPLEILIQIFRANVCYKE